MALFKSPIFTAVSGSVGGLNFAHTRAGSYIRGKARNTNTATPHQSYHRTVVSLLTHRWTTTLTTLQRNAWHDYAANTPLPGRFGDPRNVTGRAMYLRGNIARVNAGFPVIDNAPAIFALATFGTAVHLSAGAIFNDVRFAFDDTQPWVNETGSFLLVSAAPTQNASRTALASPFRYETDVPGSGVFPPSSPKSFVFPYKLSPGQRVFYRLVLSQADGRFSTPQTLTGLVA
jgi:hypothetical protein